VRGLVRSLVAALFFGGSQGQMRLQYSPLPRTSAFAKSGLPPERLFFQYGGSIYTVSPGSYMSNNVGM